MIELLRIGQPHEVVAMEAATRRAYAQDVRIVDDPAAATGERVVVPWIRHPHSLAPLAAVFALRGPRRTVSWIDFDGSRGRCGVGFLLRESLRAGAFLVWSAIVRCIAAIVRRMPAASGPAPHRDEPPLIVLPVVPDLSHTFIYREALRMAALDERAQIVVLEHGLPSAPDHAEGAEVMARAAFLPRRGIMRHYASIAFWLLTHPRRASRLLRLYGPRAGELFGKLPLREPRHPGNAFALATMLRRHPRGPIHVYGSTYSANVVMGASLLLGRRYSITSYVDFDFDYDHRMLEAKYATSRFFRVCTAYCRTRIEQLVPNADASRVPVILFGLDLATWGDATRPAGRGVLFSACRIVEKKGLHFMPAALARLRERGIEATWRIAGDGPERARVEALVDEHGVRDRVEFLGSITTEDVHRELRTADLAVLPCIVTSDGERDGIPIFFTEAMALGVPVLTTPVSGIPELIQDGETGFLVPPEDGDALAERLAEVLSDADLRARVGARGRAIVHERLDLDRAAAELLELVRTS